MNADHAGQPQPEETAPRRPIAEGLYVLRDGGVHLVGGRHRKSGALVFPMPSERNVDAYEPELLPTRGRLWSWTVQRFRPKAPYAGPDDDAGFKPFAVGYMETEEGPIIEGVLDTDEFEKLHVNMPLQTCVRPFKIMETGEIIETYAFRPVKTGHSES